MFMNPFLDYFKAIDLFNAKSVTTYDIQKNIGRNKLFVECLKGITDILVKKMKHKSIKNIRLWSFAISNNSHIVNNELSFDLLVN